MALLLGLHHFLLTTGQVDAWGCHPTWLQGCRAELRGGDVCRGSQPCREAEEGARSPLGLSVVVSDWVFTICPASPSFHLPTQRGGHHPILAVQAALKNKVWGVCRSPEGAASWTDAGAEVRFSSPLLLEPLTVCMSRSPNLCRWNRPSSRRCALVMMSLPLPASPGDGVAPSNVSNGPACWWPCPGHPGPGRVLASAQAPQVGCPASNLAAALSAPTGPLPV